MRQSVINSESYLVNPYMSKYQILAGGHRPVKRIRYTLELNTSFFFNSMDSQFFFKYFEKFLDSSHSVRKGLSNLCRSVEYILYVCICICIRNDVSGKVLHIRNCVYYIYSILLISSLGCYHRIQIA